VRALTDQTVLVHVAKTDSDGSVRKAAVEKLTDQTVLARVAKTDSDDAVRVAAAGNLTDQALAQAVFARVAQSGKVESVRMAAVEKLTDQALLAEIRLGVEANREAEEKRRAQQQEELESVLASRRAAGVCGACGGELQVIHEGRPWCYYECPNCGGAFCNPCVAGAGRAHPTASAACPICKKDLRNYRKW
jgi:hypothetical protein